MYDDKGDKKFRDLKKLPGRAKKRGGAEPQGRQINS
jgi:hypothetical protein